ncbi:MAG: hypothetical protein HUU22_09120 [Phycisphaerae bacterium]|nr:hypothetical protein [Phycisphaerae bacterium]
MVAIGILGVGLVMVAAIFPVALSQHKDAVDAATAITIANRAAATVRAKVDMNRLWKPVTNGVMPQFEDSPWMALNCPMYLADATGNPLLDPPPSSVQPVPNNYLNHISNPAWVAVPSLSTGPVADNAVSFLFSDLYSDPRAPRVRAAIEQIPQRLIWYPFYQQTASGEIRFAAAVVRHTAAQRYARQDLGFAGCYATPAPTNELVSQPVPWRVLLTYMPSGAFAAPNRLVAVDVPAQSGGPNAAIGQIANAAPPGSRIMLTGMLSRRLGGYQPLGVSSAIAGRVLTVVGTVRSGTSNTTAIEVREDISDLPRENQIGTPGASVEAWVFPPNVTRNSSLDVISISIRPPCVDWIFF